MNAVLRLIRIENIPKNLLWFGVGAAVPVKMGFGLLPLSLAIISYLLCWFLIYTLNDYSDREEDKNHKRKALRPIPSGKVSLGEAKVLMFLFLIGSIACALLVTPSFLVVILATLAVGLLYNNGCRNRIYCAAPLLWAMEFLRILAGATYAGLWDMPWALFIGLPAFYLFCYHFYWEDAKRFDSVKASKLAFFFVSSVLIGLWVFSIMSMQVIIVMLIWGIGILVGLFKIKNADFEKRLQYSYYFIYWSFILTIALLLL